MILLSSNCIGKYYFDRFRPFSCLIHLKVCVFYKMRNVQNYGLNVSGSVNHLVVPDSLRSYGLYSHQAPMSMAFSSQEY